MKLFFDTNVWIRYIVKDNQKQYDDVKSLITANESGLLKLYTSSIIFLEINYVLKNLYKFKFEEILEVMDNVRKAREITLLRNTDLDKTIDFYRHYRIKFTDCLIAGQLRKDITLVTFDLEFRKLKEIDTKTPEEILSALKN